MAKQIAPVALALAGSPSDPQPMLYGGILTQVVTQTDDPLCFVGQVFSGFYQYCSVGADGTFYVTGILDPGAVNRSLSGLINMRFPDAGWQPNAIRSTMNDGRLRVVGGVVTAFDWSWQMGDYYMSFAGTTFRAQYTPADGAGFTVSGSVSFGLPIRQG